MCVQICVQCAVSVYDVYCFRYFGTCLFSVNESIFVFFLYLSAVVKLALIDVWSILFSYLAVFHNAVNCIIVIPEVDILLSCIV